ncbi:MAG: hypothetical protein ABIM50_12710 [Novosphingobium sp.]
MFDSQTVRRRNLPLIMFALAPAVLLCACNGQDKQELAAALDRAEVAAQRAEAAQHAAEAAAVKAQTDRLAAGRDEAVPDNEPQVEHPPEPKPDVPQENPPPPATTG